MLLFEGVLALLIWELAELWVIGCMLLLFGFVYWLMVFY